MNENVWPLILLGGGLLAFLLVVSFLSKNYSLNNFKSKTVGDGQHGTARWATPREISKTYRTVPFRPRRWRKGKELPTEQGLILGSVGGDKRKSKGGSLLKISRKLLEKLRRPVAGKQKRKPKKKSKVLSKVKKMIEEQGDIRALVDSDDIHCLMIGASGVGKTAFFLYPNLEYACACGMSYLALDTKGDLARNYGAIASRYYGYRVSVIDLRNPTRSDGFNFLCAAGHKALYGPTGTGLLISDGEYSLSTIIEGGTGATSALLEQTPFLPEKLESGTINTVGIIGLGEGLTFVRQKTPAVIKAHEEKLCRQLYEQLSDIDKIKFYEADQKKVPILSFNIGDIPSAEIASYLSEKGFALRGGLQCAAVTHTALGTIEQGTVRFSPSAFSTPQQVTALSRTIKIFAANN